MAIEEAHGAEDRWPAAVQVTVLAIPIPVTQIQELAEVEDPVAVTAIELDPQKGKYVALKIEILQPR